MQSQSGCANNTRGQASEGLAGQKKFKGFIGFKGQYLNLVRGVALFVALAILLTFSFQPSFADPAQQQGPMIPFTKYNQDFLTKGQLQAIETYDRMGLYNQTKSVLSSMCYNSDGESFLYQLTLLMMLERYYYRVDDMYRHAVLLYEKSNTDDLLVYRLHALDCMAYSEYQNYDSTRYQTYVNEMLALQSKLPEGKVYSRFMVNATMSAFMTGTPENAIKHINAAYELHQSGEDTVISIVDESIFLQGQMAEVYAVVKDFKKAKRLIEGIIPLIDERDHEVMAVAYLNLAAYNIELGDYEGANTAIALAWQHYKDSSQLYKSAVPPDYLLRVEARVAYFLKDYERSADLTHQISQPNYSSEVTQRAIGARSASTAFQMAEFEKQVNLLVELQKTQQEQIKLKNQFLSLAAVAIVLMTIIMILLWWVMNWQKQQKNTLFHLSMTDQLTQIDNRRSILQYLDDLGADARMVAMLDIDNFKRINDLYGHPIGDTILKRIAGIIKETLGSLGTVGRYGGEEFFIIFNQQDFQIAKFCIENIRMRIEATAWEELPSPTTITLSAGLICAPWEANHLHLKGSDLLQYADALLLQAKDGGRNSVAALELGPSSRVKFKSDGTGLDLGGEAGVGTGAGTGTGIGTGTGTGTGDGNPSTGDLDLHFKTVGNELVLNLDLEIEDRG